MRPLELTFSALGPFAGQQTLDFTALQGSSFFLIHGPTGAGKTTILDAICFALYGETSGGEREVKQMRCDLADPGLATAVTFDFALGGARYRVSRQAEHERPKTRCAAARGARRFQRGQLGQSSLTLSFHLGARRSNHATTPSMASARPIR